jgi:hypothetical protein
MKRVYGPPRRRRKKGMFTGAVERGRLVRANYGFSFAVRIVACR